MPISKPSVTLALLKMVLYRKVTEGLRALPVVQHFPKEEGSILAS